MWNHIFMYFVGKLWKISLQLVTPKSLQFDVSIFKEELKGTKEAATDTNY